MGKDRVDAGRSGTGRAGAAVGQPNRAGQPTPGATPRQGGGGGGSGGGRGGARARKRQSNNRFFAGLALLALAGGGVLAYVATRPNEPAVRTVDPNLPPAKAEGYLYGNASAPVQIIEFADFECPACGQFATITAPDVKKRLVDAGLASYRFYDYPLEMHRNTVFAHHAAACANEQGKFWQMHDQLFLGQHEWNTQATRNPKGVFEGYAKTVGLNEDQWESCYDSRKYEAQIAANKAEGDRRAVGQTPTFIIGNKQYAGSLPYDQVKQLVTEAAAAAGVSAPAAGATPADTTQRAPAKAAPGKG